jgi:hypothetical protein
MPTLEKHCSHLCFLWSICIIDSYVAVCLFQGSCQDLSSCKTICSLQMIEISSELTCLPISDANRKPVVVVVIPCGLGFTSSLIFLFSFFLRQAKLATNNVNLEAIFYPRDLREGTMILSLRPL